MLLAIGTAHRACSLALVEDGRCLRRRHEMIGRGHAERLVPMIAELLGEVRPAEIAVEVGPGSFTGIRVGVAAARGLALAWKVPVHGISSMHLLAARAYADHPGLGTLTVLLDGGRGEVFVQLFEDGAAKGPPKAKNIADVRIVRGAVIGTGVPLIPGLSARTLGSEAPNAADACLLAAAARELPPIPIYVRAPDAKAPQ